jgi:hypothetical protein
MRRIELDSWLVYFTKHSQGKCNYTNIFTTNLYNTDIVYRMCLNFRRIIVKATLKTFPYQAQKTHKS